MTRIRTYKLGLQNAGSLQSDALYPLDGTSEILSMVAPRCCASRETLVILD